MSAATELLAVLQKGWWAVAGGLVEPLRGGVDLGGLAPDPAFGDTAAAGRVLLPLAPVAAGGTDPAGLLASVVTDLRDAQRTPLRGWRAGPNSAPGVSLAWRQPTGYLVIGLTPGPAPRLDVVGTGSVRTGELGGGDWSAQVTAGFDGVWDVSLTTGSGVVTRSAAAGSLTIALARATRTVLGDLASIGSWRSTVTVDAASATWSATGDLDRLEPSVGSGLLGELLPAVSMRPVSAGLVADATSGVRFSTSGGPVIDLPSGAAAEAVAARSVRLALGVSGDLVTLDAVALVEASLAGMPVQVTADGLGLRLGWQLDGTRLGLLPGGPGALTPDTLSIVLDAPPVRGQGLIARIGPDEWAGVVDVDFGLFEARALLLLSTGAASPSVLVLLTARFNPGLPLGMGFSLDGVGGLVAVNRRADPLALRDLVQAGRADLILFPEQLREPQDAIAVVRVIAAAFPIRAGHVTIAPMLKLGWAGGLVSVSAAVVLDVAQPSQVLLLGRVVIALPRPSLPLVFLQASVYGRIDLGIPLLEVLVSLAGSNIVGLPVSGDLYVLVRGGDDPLFVLSAGGFHPRYQRPAGVPELNRLRISLGGGGLGLSLTGYLAITSNSVQFGGQVRLDATIAGCGVEGWLGLDALVAWEPSFSFSVRVRAGVAVKVFGAKLLGVALDFTLEGPAPWHAFGSGEISLLFVSVSLDFDVTWGGGQPALPPVAGDPVLDALTQAFVRSDAWSVAPRTELATPLRLTEQAVAAVASGSLVLGDAEVRAAQKVVPWGVRVNRFASRTVAPQTWHLGSAGLGPDGADTAVAGTVRDKFALGEFQVLTDDQQLSAPAYSDADSGVRFTGAALHVGTPVPIDERYETGWADGRAPAPLPGAAAWAAERPALALSRAARLAAWVPAKKLVTLKAVR